MVSLNFPPEDTYYPDSRCMMCSKVCETWEVICTGDEDAYEGFEVWAYCRECDCETLHPCKQIKTI